MGDFGNCSTCKLISICKYTDNYKKMKETINTINEYTETKVLKASCKCEFYEEKKIEVISKNA